MGMTENTKLLIKAVCNNDYTAVKKIAIACLSEDTTAKNADFVEKYKKMLINGTAVIELPPNVKYKIEALDMSQIFREDRYYLTEKNKEIVDQITRLKNVAERLATLDINYLNATMLYGESGTGKTTLAKYTAYKLGLPYVYLNFSQIIDSLMGKTSSSISLVFDYVKRNPCVFMLDEIDAIGIRRSHSSDHGADGELSRITITLMQEFDKLPNTVVLIAATNRIDRIDEALLNRFTQAKEICLPTVEEKEKMARKYLSTIPLNISENEIENIVTKAMQPRSHREVINAVINGIADKFEKGEL